MILFRNGKFVNTTKMDPNIVSGKASINASRKDLQITVIV